MCEPASKRYAATDPKVERLATRALAFQQAVTRAAQVGGRVFTVADTHSMEPLLYGNNFVVTAPAEYENLKMGDVVTYKPKWNREQMTIHRLVAQDRDGWIASGDNNPRSESWERVRKDNYYGRLVAIYAYEEPKKSK